MKVQISVKDRETQTIFLETLLASKILCLLYKKPKGFFRALRTLSAWPFLSRIVGLWAHTARSKKQITPFIQDNGVDTTEFLHDRFTTFSDFFIRKLRPEARPLAASDCVIPCDARVLAYPSYESAPEIFVKGEKFALQEFLGEYYTEEYAKGPIVILRLAPCDYHRFHIPLDGVPQEKHLVNGKLFSVNPFALRADFTIFTKNKRVIIPLDTMRCGQVLLVAIGATSVGSIQTSYLAHKPHKKGDELGYFDVGGSSVVLCFRANTLQLDPDLVDTTIKEGIETRCKMGQSLGHFL